MHKGYEIREMLKAGASTNDIIERFGSSKSTISYHRKLLGMGITQSAIEHDWESIQKYLDEKKKLSEASEEFGVNINSLVKARNKGKISFLSIDKMSLIEYVNSLDGIKADSGNRKQFIKKMVREGAEYKCSECKISEWNNQPLVLQLDHIDGNGSNNSPENLRIICPNCHSQTLTFAGRNVKRIKCNLISI